MQKLTVFSAILSLSIILIIGDLVSHDYLEEETVTLPTQEEMEEVEAEVKVEEIEDFIEESELPEDSEVDLSSESIDLNVLIPVIEENLMLESGFFDPVLKDTIFSGYVFQFIPFSDPDAFVYQWNLFDGETYVGSLYEMKYPNETASFQGYLALRQAGSAQSELGSVNEANNYKDSSFYFNHTAKSQTVHLVIKSGKNIYAFEYAHLEHETMKNLFDLLP
ncbi:MAG: hypothetical protein ACI9QC_000969 [Oceanicoccus sp.]|jgi:hypothetical protein